MPKSPLRKSLEVKTVTTDLASAMMLTVRTAFLAASLINDRFYVQQLLSEVVDHLRIRYRWEVLDAENKAIKEHRAKRKSIGTREKRQRIGQWEPQKMANRETLPQVISYQPEKFADQVNEEMYGLFREVSAVLQRIVTMNAEKSAEAEVVECGSVKAKG